jgi:hypothetical protein
LRVQVTVVVAIGKVEPDSGVQLKERIAATALVASAVYVTAAPAGLVACSQAL